MHINHIVGALQLVSNDSGNLLPSKPLISHKARALSNNNEFNTDAFIAEYYNTKDVVKEKAQEKQS